MKRKMISGLENVTRKAVETRDTGIDYITNGSTDTRHESQPAALV